MRALRGPAHETPSQACFTHFAVVLATPGNGQEWVLERTAKKVMFDKYEKQEPGYRTKLFQGNISMSNVMKFVDEEQQQSYNALTKNQATGQSSSKVTSQCQT